MGWVDRAGGGGDGRPAGGGARGQPCQGARSREVERCAAQHMRRKQVPPSLRALVRQRAKNCCEYCLTPETAMLELHEIDHIIPRKHGGSSEAENLALACFTCNRHKGADLSGMDPSSGRRTGLFHPRQHRWSAHFVLQENRIAPRTAIGRATERVLQLNSPFQLERRELLLAAGLIRIPPS